MPYAIDLFCGAGGCSEGLIQSGFHILFSSDISEMAGKTYMNRHEQLGLIQGKNTWFEQSDIRELKGDEIENYISKLEFFKNKKLPEIDLIMGGPSCQGFSRAGKRDKSDPRNMLFGEYVRIVSEIKPKYLILENVEGFIDMEFLGYKGMTGIEYPDGSVTPDILKSELNEIGYDTLEPMILNAADYGVPQKRKRVIFIGYQKGLTPPKYPTPTHSPNNYVSIIEAIGDLSNNGNQLTKYQLESRNGRTAHLNGNPVKAKKILNNELSKLSELVKERFSLFQEGETATMLRKKIQKNGIDISKCKSLVELCSTKLSLPQKKVVEAFKNGNVTNHYLDILLTKKNVRQRWASNNPASTVVTIPDDYIHPLENRTFTVRELARCQSFDDSFEFLGKRTTGGLLRRIETPQYTQVGNAVPPLLAKALADEIRKVL